MKTKMTKTIFTCLLLLMGLFASTVANAQSCNGNKIRVYRCDRCRNHNSKCIEPSQLNNNLANGWQLQWCAPCYVRLSQSESDESTTVSVSPNPVSNIASIAFTLDESQKVSLRIFDMNGRLVSTLADKLFEEGENE